MGQSIKLILWVEFEPYYKDFCEINQAAFVKFSIKRLYKFYFSLRKSGCHPPFTYALLDDFDGGLNLLPAAGYVPSLGRKFGRQPSNSPQDNAIKI